LHPAKTKTQNKPKANYRAKPGTGHDCTAADASHKQEASETEPANELAPIGAETPKTQLQGVTAEEEQRKSRGPYPSEAKWHRPRHTEGELTAIPKRSEVVSTEGRRKNCILYFRGGTGSFTLRARFLKKKPRHAEQYREVRTPKRIFGFVPGFCL